MRKNHTGKAEPYSNGFKRERKSMLKKITCILCACALVVGLVPNLAYAGTSTQSQGSASASLSSEACHIVYDGSGQSKGSAPADSYAYSAGESAVVMDKGSLVKYGYAFNGWFGSDGNFYQPGGTITFTEPGETITLNAGYSDLEGMVAQVEKPSGAKTVYDDLHVALKECGAGATVTLLKDIKLTDSWTPIENFAGTFDGNGYSITGLSVTSDKQNVGMFDSLQGEVKNLTLYNASVISKCAEENAIVGTVAGALGSTAKISNVTLDSCSVVSQKDQVGGIVGSSAGEIENCALTSCTVVGNEQVGGIVGYFWCGSIKGCTAGTKTNQTTITGRDRVGGLVGKFQAAAGNLGSSRLVVGNNSINAEVSVPTSGNAGGVAGQLMGDSSCYDIKGNSINVTFVGVTSTNPIGKLRTGSVGKEFSNALATNVVANWWSDTTLSSGSFTYLAAETGTSDQTILRSDPTAGGYVLDAVYEGTTFGALIQIGEKNYYYGVNAFSQMADVVAVAGSGTPITVYGSGNVGSTETVEGEGVEFVTPGTNVVSGNEWANLAYLQLNPSKYTSDARYVLNIDSSKLVVTKPQLRTASDLYITGSHVDFAKQKNASRGYLYVFRDSTMSVKDSVVGYDSNQGNSGNVVAGETSENTQGNMAAYISGTFEAENSTIYTFTTDAQTDAFSLYDRGGAKFTDSVLYSGYITIGALENGREDRGTLGREGEIATLELDNSKIISNNSDRYALNVGSTKDGELILTNGSQVEYANVDATVAANGVITMDATSHMAVKSIENDGTIKVDMTGATAALVKLIEVSETSYFGTYEFAEGKDNGYTLKAEGNSLYAYKTSADIAVNADWSGMSFGQEVYVGETPYYIGVSAFSTIADAAKAAPVGTASTIVLNGDQTLSSEAAFGGGQDVTFKGNATIGWDSWFMIGRDASQGSVDKLAKVTFDGATITKGVGGSGDSAFNISGAESDSATKGYGQLDIINSSNIHTTWTVNKNILNVNTGSVFISEQLLDVSGRPASETPSGEDYEAQLNINNATVNAKGSANSSGLTIGKEGKGLVTVSAGMLNAKSIEATAKATMQLSGTSSVAVDDTFTNAGAITMTCNDKITATSFKNTGTIKVDMTGATASVVKLIEASEASNYGTYEFAEGKDNGYALKVIGNDLCAVTTTINYSTHVQNIGWQDAVSNGKVAGTMGESLRLESIKISLGQGTEGGISYRTHVQNEGWQDYVVDGEESGTTGSSYRLEAIQIKLTGDAAETYDVYYRVHAQNIGWMGWAKNDEKAGTEGYSYRLEAIQIVVVGKGEPAPTDVEGITSDVTYAFDSAKEGISTPYPEELVSYNAHVQNIGWQDWSKLGGIAGTSGQELRVEAFHMSLGGDAALLNGSIKYSAHVQNLGWQNYVADGAMAGTMGESLRTEAIQVKLTDEVAEKYDVYYRVHVQNVGWMGWAKNDEKAGTEGFAYRLEGMQVVLVEKDAPAPSTTYGGITSDVNYAFKEV